jgi:Domain of unknown function (DUF4190)/zinc-ribbon domain
MAFCPRCAAPNVDTAAACAACGSPLSASPGVPGAPPPLNQAFAGAGMLAPRTNGLAIAGFICSFFCGLIGLILSIVAYNQCKNSGGQLKGEGLALAGIIIAAVSMILGIILQIAMRS